MPDRPAIEDHRQDGPLKPVPAELDALESEQARRAKRDAVSDVAEKLAEELNGLEVSKTHKSLLELNGYNAVRTELLNAVNTLAAIPAEAVDACLAFARQAARKAELSPHPQAAQARDQMLAECAVYNAVLKLLHELEENERRAMARERIVAR